MAEKKSRAFLVLMLVLTLFLLLGVALLVYGSATWQGFDAPARIALAGEALHV